MKTLAAALLVWIAGTLTGGVTGGGLSPPAAGGGGAVIADGLGAHKTTLLGPKDVVYFDVNAAVTKSGYSAWQVAHELECVWDIDTTNQGTMGNYPVPSGSGTTRSRETYTGGCFNVAFEYHCATGGGNKTYVTQLTVRDTLGTTSKTVNITCEDLDGTIAAADSVCVDLSTGDNDHDGCPTHVSNTASYTNFQSAINTEIGTNNRQAIFVSAAAWPMTASANINPAISEKGRIVGVGIGGDDWATWNMATQAWVGSNLIDFDETTSNFASAFDFGGNADDWRVIGLSIKNENLCTVELGGGSGDACDRSGCPGSPCEKQAQATASWNGGAIGSGLTDVISQFPTIGNVFSQYSGVSGGSNNSPADGDGHTRGTDFCDGTNQDCYYIGYTSNRNGVEEHGLRIQPNTGAVMMGNYIEDWTGSKAGIAVRSDQTFANVWGNVIRVIDQANSTHGIQLGPENNTDPETVEHSQVAQNTIIVKQALLNRPISIQGPRNLVRHNVIKGDATNTFNNCIRVEERGTTGVTPEDVITVDNVCWVDQDAGSISIVSQVDCTSCGPINNNLGGSNSGTLTGGGSNGNVTDKASTFFVDAAGDDYEDFLPNANDGNRVTGPLDVERAYDGTTYTDDSGLKEF